VRNRPDASDGTPSILVIEEGIKYFLTMRTLFWSREKYDPFSIVGLDNQNDRVSPHQSRG
jgi:hypothetical protein